MLLDYKYSESTVKPAEIEKTKTTIYIRKNIVSKKRTTSLGTQTYWTYQEAALTLKEFAEYSNILNAKNANDISQLMVNQEAGDNNQMIIMEAIADLYDAIASLKQEGLS